MSYEEIESSARPLPSFNAALCALLGAYTVVSILDHDRWMKEWGNDHEAVAVMHLRFPTLSAALAMGFGAITTVQHVGLVSIDLEGIEIEYDVLLTVSAYGVAVCSFFASVLVAQRDLFAGLDRMERLKMCILERHTIADLKKSKHIGKKMAYFGRPIHVALAGVMLAIGMLGSWVMNVLAMRGDFYVVWLPGPLALLVLGTLASSIMCCWLLFRILVWKPSDMLLRPLCSIVVALCSWAMDFFGNFEALRFERLLGSKPQQPTYFFPDYFPVEDGGAEWEVILLIFGSVMTQHAISLQLRLAYCGLQDANLDLQLLAGTIGFEDHSRRSSARSDQAGGTRHRSQALKSPADSTCRVDAPNGRGLTNTSPQTPPNRGRQPFFSGSQSPAGTPANTRTSPRRSSVTMANAATRVNLARPSTIVAALTRMSSTLGAAPPAASRSIRVQPVGVEKAYIASSPTPSVGSSAEGVGILGSEPPSIIAVRQLEEIEEGDWARRASTAASRQAVKTGKDGETADVGPTTQMELPAKVI